MVFSSLTFLLVFLPAVIGLYFLFPSLRWKNGVLLAASLVFYAWGEPLWVFALVLLTLISWFCSVLACSFGRKGRVFFTALGVALPLCVLAVVKYAGFLLSPFGVAFPAIRMPLGISFFTFQIITYNVDVYRGTPVQRSPLRLLLYVSCFPQLVAGPIVRYGDVNAALEARETTMEGFSSGMRRFACGLGKKVLLANLCGKAVEAAVAAGRRGGLCLGGAWYVALLYALQVYFDFSGYSDMAIGMGRIFGFSYAENFDYPYLSRSIREFWRRWHISLGTFFREYLYIPLGGSRRGTLRTVVNLLIVWMLTGLWHGANVNFVLWGLYFFAFLCLERFVPALSRVPGFIRGIAVFLLLLIGWVIFYFTDAGEMVSWLSALFGAGVPLMTAGTLAVVRRYSFFPLVALFAAFPLWKRLPLVRSTFFTTLWLTAVYALSVLFIVGESYNPFIYFRF